MRGFKIAIILVPLLFYSCAASFTKNKKIKVTHAPNEKVELTAISFGAKVTQEKDSTYKVSNRELGYIISSSKEHYQTTSRVITRKKFNYYKLIDFIIPLAADIIYFSPVYKNIKPDLRSVVILPGIFWWIPAFRGPFYVYDKNYAAPTPQTLYPKRTVNQNYISAMDLHFNVPKENFTTTTFLDYDSFLNKNKVGKKSDVILPSGNKTFENDGLKVLDKFNFRDTTNNYFTTKLTDLKLVFDVKTLEENLILNAKQLQLKTKVSLINNFSQTPILTKTINANTQWRRNILFQGPLSLQHQSDFLEDVLTQFLSDTEVQQTLTDYKVKMKEKGGTNFDYLTLPKAAEYVQTIPEAVKSVVIVLTKDGHGSGCVISKDGYIVTNSHVIANNDTNITVQLNDSSRHKAKLMAANLGEDLALIKIDTSLTYCFNIDLPKQIEVGQEVYSIGAYNIDDYTVSVAKGIISSFRKVDGKEYIQSDVTINSGNSGGALISPKGELLGIITAKMVGNGIEGIGFAIPYRKIQDALKIKFE